VNIVCRCLKFIASFYIIIDLTVGMTLCQSLPKTQSSRVCMSGAVVLKYGMVEKGAKGEGGDVVAKVKLFRSVGRR